MICPYLQCKTGMRCKQNNELPVGPYAYDCRNSRGEMLLNWLQCNGNRSWNSFFQKRKPRTWTWRSPNGLTFNQIDYVIARPTLKVLDVSVLSGFHFDTDHRLIRAKLKMKIRRRQTKQRQIPTVSRALFHFGVSNDDSATDATSKEIYEHLNTKLRGRVVKWLAFGCRSRDLDSIPLGAVSIWRTAGAGNKARPCLSPPPLQTVLLRLICDLCVIRLRSSLSKVIHG